LFTFQLLRHGHKKTARYPEAASNHEYKHEETGRCSADPPPGNICSHHIHLKTDTAEIGKVQGGVDEWDGVSWFGLSYCANRLRRAVRCQCTAPAEAQCAALEWPRAKTRSVAGPRPRRG